MVLEAYVMVLDELADSDEGVTATAWTMWTYGSINRPKPFKVERQLPHGLEKVA
jgi:hypothetical protein